MTTMKGDDRHKEQQNLIVKSNQNINCFAQNLKQAWAVGTKLHIVHCKLHSLNLYGAGTPLILSKMIDSYTSRTIIEIRWLI